MVLSETKENQIFYSSRVPVILDAHKRVKKAKKIVSILRDFYGEDLSKLSCLDIGCSGGHIDMYLGKYFNSVMGIDIDEKAIQLAKANNDHVNVEFKLGNAEILDLKDNSMDVVICNHVYAYGPDPNNIMKEIYRVLKPLGFCYFAASNKRKIIEGSYKLPFLSWLSRSLANYYIRLMRKGDLYSDRHMILEELKQLVRPFELHDYTLKIIKEPMKYHSNDIFILRWNIHTLLAFIAKRLYRFLPTYIWILTKK